MAQYHPEHKALGHDKLGRRINNPELEHAIKCFTDRGLTRLDHRFEAFNKCMFDKLAVLFQKEMDW